LWCWGGGFGWLGGGRVGGGVGCGYFGAVIFSSLIPFKMRIQQQEGSHGNARGGGKKKNAKRRSLKGIEDC